jgi:hypothetical protein
MTTAANGSRPPARMPGLSRSTGIVDGRGRVHDVLSGEEDASAPTAAATKKSRRTSFGGFGVSVGGLQRAASLGTKKLGQISRTLSTTGPRHARSASDSGKRLSFSVSRRRNDQPTIVEDTLPVASPVTYTRTPSDPGPSSSTSTSTHTTPARSSTSPKIMADIAVPQLLREGTPMTKVTAKKQKRIVLRLDPDQGRLVYEGKKLRISTSPLYYVHLPYL